MKATGRCAADRPTVAATVHADNYTQTLTVSNRAERVDANDGSVTVAAGSTPHVELRMGYQGNVLNKSQRIDCAQAGVTASPRQCSNRYS